MGSVVLHRPHFGCSAERVGDALGRAFVVRGEGHSDVAVIENGVVGAVGLLDLIERLGDDGSESGSPNRRRLPEF